MQIKRILLTLWFIAITSFGQDNEVFEGFYFGSFNNDAPLGLSIASDGDEILGNFVLIGDTTRYPLIGKINAEKLYLLSQGTNSPVKIEAVAANTIDLDAVLTFRGKKHTIRFSKLSSIGRIQDQRGTVSLYAEYPKFIVPNPALLELTQEMRKSISNTLLSFVEYIEEEAQSGRGLETLEWEKEIFYDVSYANQHYISLLIRTYEFGEGNLFREFLSAAHYRIEDNEVIALGLRDLFEKRQQALQEINLYIIEYLKNSGNQFAKKGIIKYFDESQLSAFVVNQVGLQFYFPPGVLSESSDYEFVTVPFEVIEDFVGENSPLTTLVKFY